MRRDPPAVPPASEGQRRLWQVGRTGWALLGIAGVAVVAGYLASVLVLLVVPLVLALFPATLLVPVTDWLKDRGVPAAAAAALSILGGILAIGLVVGAMVPLVAMEAGDLAESASEGIEELQQFLEDGPLGLELGGVDELLEMGQDLLGEAGDVASQALDAAVVAIESVIGLLLLFVILFFYLKDGRRLAAGLASTVPARHRDRVRASMDQAWSTLGSYFRGQLLVALVDAVAIGLALLLLGVPLALPLAVLIFFGGLFPIVGAVVTGALAVLVAMADAGLVTGLIVLGVVLAVQQLESNVLEPIILGRAIELHPLVVLLAITAGSLTLGILGAFLAVPVAAITARVIALLREEQEDATQQEAAQQEAAQPG
jgi:putative heme transporter